MDHKQASQILIGLLEKSALSAKEKAAITTAIGVLAWTALAENRIKTIKDAQNRKKNYG